MKNYTVLFINNDYDKPKNHLINIKAISPANAIKKAKQNAPESATGFKIHL